MVDVREHSGFVSDGNSPIHVWEDWGDGMHWAGNWNLLCLVLFQGCTNVVVIIPGSLACGMLESHLDPLSRFPFRRVCPGALCTGHYDDEDDSYGMPSPEGWQSFQPWQQMDSDIVDGQPKHFSQMRPSL